MSPSPLTAAIMELAAAINRLAATQEKPAPKSGKLNFGTATYAYEDSQTRELRQVERERSGDLRED